MEDNNTTNIIAEALAATPGDYLEATLAQRNPGPKAVGSIWDVAQTPESLAALEWVERPHTNVTAPVRAFVAQLPGSLGALPISSLIDVELVVAPAHGGKIPDEAEVQLQLPASAQGEAGRVTETWMLVGPHGDVPALVYTVHPGEPVPFPKPISLAAAGGAGAVISDDEALALGFVVAKIVYI